MTSKEKQNHIVGNIVLYDPCCKEVYDFADNYFANHPIKVNREKMHTLYESAIQKTDRATEYILEHLTGEVEKSYLEDLQQEFTNYLTNRCIINNLDLYRFDAELFTEIANIDNRLISLELLDGSVYLTEKAWHEILIKHTAKS